MPSLSQPCLALEKVTRLPDQLCASSCAISETKDLSPTITVGVMNDRRGFSMPPNGNDGGSTSRS